MHVYFKGRIISSWSKATDTFFSKKAFLNPYYISLSPQMVCSEEEELPKKSIKSNPIKAQ